MNQKMMLLATIGFSGLVACSATSNGTSDNSAAGVSTITVVAIPSTVAPGATSQITFSGGSGSYQNAYASQGTLTPQTATTWLYTAPTAPTGSTVTIQVSDTLGAGGMGGIFISGSTTGTTTTPALTSSCAGSYSLNVGGIGATLGVIQNVAGQISGYLYFPANSVNTQPYTFPIIGTCAAGAISFQNVSLGQTYSGNFSNSGTSISVSGSVNTTAGTVGWSGTSTSVSPAPVAETQACGGQYQANIAGTMGTLILVHNGGGGVAGYLSLAYGSTTNIYSITGTCGATLNLKNNTNGSTYTGSATFNGASVLMSGSFVTAGGQTYAWSAAK